METLVLTLLAIAVFTWIILLIPMQPTPRLVVAIVAAILATAAVLHTVAPGLLR